MTTEELRAMDAEIHQKVMGLACERVAPSFVRPNPVDWCEKSPFMQLAPGVPGWVQIPAYSTDIAAAWLVVEKLTTSRTRLGPFRRYRRTIEQEGGLWYAGILWFADSDEPGPPAVWEYCAEGETAPIAICRAALKATA